MCDSNGSVFPDFQANQIVIIFSFLFIDSKEGESDWLTYIKLSKFKSVSTDNLNC